MGCSDFCIFFLSIGMSLISNTKGSTNNVYKSNTSYSWIEARKHCDMVTLDQVSSISHSQGKVWVDATVTYTQWVDFLGCFTIKQDKISSRTSVTIGEQVPQCLEKCSGYVFFGLKKSLCFCLHNVSLDTSGIDDHCYDEKYVCEGDDGAFCVDNNEDRKLLLYQKVSRINLDEDGPYNCLGVKLYRAGQKHFFAEDCKRTLYRVCSRDLFHPTENNFLWKSDVMTNWIDSARSCAFGYFVPYSYYKNTNRYSAWEHNYWLSTIRRPVFTNHPQLDRQPNYCVAVEISRSGKATRFIENCDHEFPGLCSDTQKDATEDDMASVKDILSNELLIALIVASILTTVVLAIIIIFCVRLRRGHIPSGHKPLSPTASDVVYAKVNKPTKEKPKDNVTSSKQEEKQCLVEYAMVNKQHKAVPSIEEEKLDDTYDHMDHNRSNSIVKEVGNEYDTMESVRIMNATVHQDSHDEQYLNVQTNQPNTSDHRTEDAEKTLNTENNRMDII